MAPKWVSKFYLFAGIYGVIVLVPHFFLETHIGLTHPPEITHPEFFYGFTSLALVFQFVFFLIAKDPFHYLSLMPICALEKFSFFAVVVTLVTLGKTDAVLLWPALIDFALGVGFLAARKSLLSAK